MGVVGVAIQTGIGVAATGIWVGLEVVGGVRLGAGVRVVM